MWTVKVRDREIVTEREREELERKRETKRETRKESDTSKERER